MTFLPGQLERLREVDGERSVNFAESLQRYLNRRRQ